MANAWEALKAAGRVRAPKLTTTVDPVSVIAERNPTFYAAAQREEEERRRAEEELEAEMEEQMPLYRNYSNNYGRVEAYNRDIVREELEDYAEEVREVKPRENLRGLTALALALLAGIFAMLAFWAVRYL